MKPFSLKSRLSVILLCGILTACGNLNNGRTEQSEPVLPTQEELEAKKKKEIKENIAKYVTLTVSEYGGIYVTNNTDYTIESVTISIAWKQYDFDVHKYIHYSDARTFTYIPAHGESTSIPYKYPMEDARGQITSISCSALGL